MGAQAAAAPAPEERGERKPRSSGRWCGFVRGRNADETGHWMPLPHARPAKQGPFWVPSSSSQSCSSPSQLVGCMAFPQEATPCRSSLRQTSPQRPLPGKCGLTPAFPVLSRLSAFAGVEPCDPGYQVFLQRLSALGGRLPALLLPVRGNQTFT